ncbi:MAG TPA: Hsp20/alpha crystallin family protein [Gammaproteobacteria bacterium]|nr:Hsp20/alpha crystallin family protein [Gammaproteobacteria bacterium]
MNLINWSPFGEFDSLLDRYARDLVHSRGTSNDSPPAWRPAASIVEKKGEYVISADLPAVKREDVSVTVENNVLTIKGERRYEKSAEEETEHRRETYHGVFERRFSLPDDADAEGIAAHSKDGVLTVKIPKVKPTQPEVRSITVD